MNVTVSCEIKTLPSPPLPIYEHMNDFIPKKRRKYQKLLLSNRKKFHHHTKESGQKIGNNI